MKRFIFFCIIVTVTVACKMTKNSYNVKEGSAFAKKIENIFLQLEGDFTTDINSDDSLRYRNFMKLPEVTDLKNDKKVIKIYYSPLILNQANTDFSFGFTNPDFNYRDVVEHGLGKFDNEEYRGATTKWGEYQVLSKTSRFLDIKDNKEKRLLEIRILLRDVMVIRGLSIY